jgi:hypothetical protein
VTGLRDISSCFESMRHALKERERAMKAEFEAEVERCRTGEENRLSDVRKRAHQLEDMREEMEACLGQDKVTFLQVYYSNYTSYE